MLNGEYLLTQGIYMIGPKEHIGYGISYRSQEETIAFEDLSLDFKKVSSLIAICNSLELSPLHLWDVVNDFLADIT